MKKGVGFWLLLTAGGLFGVAVADAMFSWSTGRPSFFSDPAMLQGGVMATIVLVAVGVATVRT